MTVYPSAAAVKSSHFLMVVQACKKTLRQNEIYWYDVSTPSGNRAPFLFLCTHPIWAWPAPTVQWQLTIACSPLINWDDTVSHKQCIILWASETLQNVIVWVKYASIYHSKQVESTVGYGVCRGMKGDGLCLACKFQSRLRYPSGALADSQNEFGKGGLASTFLCFCFHLSLPFTLFSLFFITVFLLSPVHPLTSHLFITCSLSHPLLGS